MARAVHGDNYHLTVTRSGEEKVSTGKIEARDENNLVYQPNQKDAPNFSIGLSGSRITHVTGTITFDCGTSEAGPGSIPSGGGGGGGSGNTSNAGNNTGSNTGTPTVSGVTINPVSATVIRGESQQFTATVNGTNNPAQTVTWTVTGGTAGTSISESGYLTVSANQTPATLTVRVTSAVDSGKSGTASVTVPPAVVTKVTVSPNSGTVTKGQTQQFSAVVEGTGNPAQTVTWSVTGGTNSSISANATFVTPGCAACLGTHEGLIAKDETCISTSNRNFPGRMGHTDGRIYLV